MTKEKIHVTANEAGRNSVMQDKLLQALDMLNEALIAGESRKEISKCIKALQKYLIRKMKIRVEL